MKTTIASGQDPFNGILLVDKPCGPTSHDVVDRIRRHFQFAKVGHAGTLDPQASGLLLILVGRGAKLSNVLMSSDKIYEGIFRFGITTNTQDAEGTIVRESDCINVTREALLIEMKKRTGDVLQTPPMFSAAKKNGVPLYKLARKGQTVKRKPKLVHIYEFTLLDFSTPRVSFRLHCTKGCYVRSVCSDIGDALGCGAHLEQLRRTRIGDFRIQDATNLNTLLSFDRHQLLDVLISIHQINLKP